MTFAHPWWLLLIAPALGLAIVDFLRRWPAGRGHRIAGIAVRVLVIAALAAAAAEPRWTGHRSDTTVVFLIDRSSSVSDEALAAAWARAGQLRAGFAEHDRVAAIQFDGAAEIAIAPGEPWLAPAERRGAGPARDATDIAGAIRLGLGLIPRGGGGHLVLLGDGRGNAGDLAAATAAAIARGVPISAIPSGAVRDDPAIAAVVLDADRVRSGATLTGRIDVDAGGVTGTGRLVVRVAGNEVVSTEIRLDGRHANIPFTYPLPPAVAPGVVSVEATLTLPGGVPDRDPGNDRAAARLVVERPPRVVILDGDDGGAGQLAAALRAEQMDIVVRRATSGPPLDLTTTDLVILANAPIKPGRAPGAIDDELGEQLVRWINDGGGLVVLGGPSALDGHYAANRLADALPVEVEPMTPELDSAATVIVILDQSGSMGMTVGGRTKLALAAEGASAVIRLLRSFDSVGVMAVQSTVEWVVPVRRVGDNTAALEGDVRRVVVGGDGIFIYTSLIAAERELAKVNTPLRHVIVFSDTADAAEQVKGIDYGYFTGWPTTTNNSLEVVKRLRERGTTVSVIGVGEGRDGGFDRDSYRDDDDDSDFLKQLALDGGGRYYRTTDANQLRGLFVQDARRLLDTHAREETISLRAVARHAALDGVDLATAPVLHGYHEVKARPAAQVVATDAKGNPILTRWPYGLGEVAVWASDAGPRWARDWVGWPGYARFWTQLARSALRRREGDATAIEAERSGDAATIRVVRRSERVDTGAPRARVVEAGRERELPLRVVEPGVYEAQLDVAGEREPTVELLDGDQVTARRTIVRPAGAELRQRGPDDHALAVLARATGGAVSPPAIAAAPRETPTTSGLAGWLILAAALLLPVDAALRRAARDRG